MCVAKICKMLYCVYILRRDIFMKNKKKTVAIIHEGGEYATCGTCRFFSQSKDSDKGICEYRRKTVSENQPALPCYCGPYPIKYDVEDNIGFDL